MTPRHPLALVLPRWVMFVVLGAAVSCGSEDTGSRIGNLPSMPDAGMPPASPSGSTSTASPCSPGELEPCQCAGGSSGSHVCDDTGKLGPCLCSAPRGQLHCGGVACQGGGYCGRDGLCPAFLGSCFTNADGHGTCDSYCRSIGAVCAAESCSSDGTELTGGYTWVSFSAANAAQCEVFEFPEQTSFDLCRTPIWLTPQKPLDDVVRCCCRQ